MKVAVLQMQVGKDLDNNLAKVETYIKDAAAQKVSFTTLPESFFLSGSEEEKVRLAESLGSGYIQNSISKLAARYNMWILSGTVPLKSPDPLRYYAGSVLFDNTGAAVSCYKKIHLFDVNLPNGESYHESKGIYPGNEIITAKVDDAVVGFSVCYDVRFPELYTNLAQKGAQVFCIPSAFTYLTGKSHWHTLIRARAIENFSYVIASNQVGEQANGKRVFGHSSIISPWGEVLVDMQSEEGIACANMELDEVQVAREQIPCHEHRVLFS